jgi:hypothetical protein
LQTLARYKKLPTLAQNLFSKEEKCGLNPLSACEMRLFVDALARANFYGLQAQSYGRFRRIFVGFNCLIMSTKMVRAAKCYALSYTLGDKGTR